MLIALSLLTFVIVVATLLPLWRNPHWVIRSLDFPRLQLSTFAALLLLAQLVFLDFSDISSWAMCLAVFLCLGWHLWWILPYTRFWPVEVLSAKGSAADRRLSIITANVLATNRDAYKLIELVQQHQPDVLVTLESDQWWQKQLEVIESDMPFTMKCPLDNFYGMHVYSRLHLSEEEIAFLVEDDIPSMHARLKMRTGDAVQLHFLHPAPPSPTENTKSSERDAELVIVARSVADSDKPTIVTGDLNDVAWSRTTRLFRKLSGLLDPRVGRGMFNTFNANYPFLRWPLDHLFHSEHFSVDSIRRLPSIGSDHFPLLTRLSYAPEQGTNPDKLEADRSDRSFAASITAEQDVSKEDVPKPGE